MPVPWIQDERRQRKAARAALLLLLFGSSLSYFSCLALACPQQPQSPAQAGPRGLLRRAAGTNMLEALRSGQRSPASFVARLAQLSDSDKVAVETPDRLEIELAAFSAKMLPRSEDRNRKAELLDRIQAVVKAAAVAAASQPDRSGKEEVPRSALLDAARLLCFGSSVGCCGEARSDVDVVLWWPSSLPTEPSSESGATGQPLLDSRPPSNTEILRRVAVAAAGPEFSEKLAVLERRLNATRPIIVFELLLDGGKTSGYTCDLGCQYLLPIYNTLLLRNYAELGGPQLTALAVAVKHWAKAQGLAKVFPGHHISSYSWTLMVIYFLQVCHNLPSLHQLALALPEQASQRDEHGRVLGAFDVFFADAKQAEELIAATAGPNGRIDVGLGELFRGFFRFYAHRFDWQSEVVSVRLGRREELGRSSASFKPELSRTEYAQYQSGLRVAPMDALPFLNIEDPIEVQRNMNFALREETAQQIHSALKKASERLDAGASLAEVLSGESEAEAGVLGEEGATAPAQLLQEERSTGAKAVAGTGGASSSSSLLAEGYLPISDLHLRVLRGELGPSRCSRCGRSFRTYVEMLEHFQLKSCKPPPFACRCLVCRKGFSSKDNLEAHFQSTGHSNAKGDAKRKPNSRTRGRPSPPGAAESRGPRGPPPVSTPGPPKS
ncbi:unnamed protein product [Polarella glacialis]|uniref:C2H2-type domain-containing protein n=1 Tax=Polarella glacialis TaxID=89957 RepID=A0A813DVQ7_POLGL|nr:unnamed protein product [Polarella glacialis]